jgi:alpha-ribazole phosphatase
MESIRFLLVRHGETDWNRQGRFLGQSAAPLNRAGVRQAAALRAGLAGETLHAVYASDLPRAAQTAGIIAEKHARPVIAAPGLRELAFGRWEGLTFSEIEQRYPQACRAWLDEPWQVCPPGGESLRDFTARLERIYAALLRDHPGETVLLVTHGGVVQVLLCLALGLAPQAYWQFHLDPGSLTEFSVYPQGAILNRFNLPGPKLSNMRLTRTESV